MRKSHVTAEEQEGTWSSRHFLNLQKPWWKCTDFWNKLALYGDKWKITHPLPVSYSSPSTNIYINFNMLLLLLAVYANTSALFGMSCSYAGNQSTLRNACISGDIMHARLRDSVEYLRFYGLIRSAVKVCWPFNWDLFLCNTVLKFTVVSV